MRRGQREFLVGGFVTAVAAVALSVWLGGSIMEQRGPLIAATVLALGDTLVALWVAGPEERRSRPVAWARCGLTAAVLTFVGLWVIIVPAVFASIAATASGRNVMALGAFAVAAVAGAIVVWATHRFAWRRVAPKAAA